MVDPLVRRHVISSPGNGANRSGAGLLIWLLDPFSSPRLPRTRCRDYYSVFSFTLCASDFSAAKDVSSDLALGAADMRLR